MEPTFFPGSSRRATLSTITLQKDRRIKLNNVRMPLTGENILGMPDWLGNAYTAVSQNFTEVEPEIQQISDLPIIFSNHAPGETPSTELFAAPETKAPSTEIKKLSVLRTGDGEDPEVTLQFNLYMPFSRDLWKWLGEMGGQEVHMQFQSGKPAVEVATPTQTTLDDIEEARREAPKPEHDDEFPMAGMPTAEYEEQVRQSLGVDDAKEKPRLVSVRPRRGTAVN